LAFFAPKITENPACGFLENWVGLKMPNMEVLTCVNFFGKKMKTTQLKNFKGKFAKWQVGWAYISAFQSHCLLCENIFSIWPTWKKIHLIQFSG
jgi:hypothetical protein